MKATLAASAKPTGASRMALRDWRPRGDCLPIRRMPRGEGSVSCDQGIWRVPTLSGRQPSQLECRRTRFGKVAASCGSGRIHRPSEDTIGIAPSPPFESDLHVLASWASLAVIGAAGSAWATVTDVRSRRITNPTVATMALLGLLARYAEGGWSSTLWGVSAVALSAIACVVPYRRAIIGGGDAKLLASLSLLIGPIATVYMLASATALGALSAYVADRQASRLGHSETAVPLAPVIGVAAAIGSICAAAI